MTFLEKQISQRARVILVILFCLVPTAFVAREFSFGHGFSKLLDVGWLFLPRALPQFQALDPITVQPKGYDGQFYAQMAIDPSMRDPHFRTMGDNPEYLGRRILLSATAWLLGFGQPAAAVMIYTLLNLAAWYALFALVLMSLRPVTVRAWLCVAGIVLTTGVFKSIAHSLTDLPAATLLFLAATLSGWSRAVALSLSVLTRESSLATAWAPLMDVSKPGFLWRGMGQICVIVLPWMMWSMYLRWHFNMSDYGGDNFAWPFQGWLYSIISGIPRRKPLMMLASLSLLAQFAYLVWHPQPKSFYWRIAISFGIVCCLLSNDPFGSEKSFTRYLLPMTIGFNVLMLEEPPRRFLWWFLAGNFGLSFSLVRALIVIFWPGDCTNRV